MKIQLFSQFYIDKNILRQQEIEYCIKKNLKAGFDKIIMLCEDVESKNYLHYHYPLIQAINIGKRPTFNDFFALLEMGENKDRINIISNTDIYFDKLEIIHTYYFFRENNPKLCLALSRWDVGSDGTLTPFLRPDSQDAWTFLHNPTIRTSIEYGMGVAGCIAGNGLVKYKRGKRKGGRYITLERLYSLLNNKNCSKPFNKEITDTYIFSYDNINKKVHFNKIKGVTQSGLQETILLKFEDNSTLQLTKDHRIMNENGEYREAINYKVGDSVLTAPTLIAQKKVKNKKYAKRSVVYIKYHPYAELKKVKGREYKRVRKARLVVEANLNKLTYKEYVSILTYDAEKSKTLKYLDPKLEVHHKNMDSTCDKLENLEVLSKSAHAKLHSFVKNFNFEYTKPKKIIEIKELGVVMTYDIEMEQHPHNFVVNDVIVHNCDNRLAYDLSQQGFILENPANSIRIFHYHPSNVRNYLNQNNEPTNRVPPPYLLINPT